MNQSSFLYLPQGKAARRFSAAHARVTFASDVHCEIE